MYKNLAKVKQKSANIMLITCKVDDELLTKISMEFICCSLRSPNHKKKVYFCSRTHRDLSKCWAVFGAAGLKLGRWAEK